MDASECPPTYGVDFELVRGVIAGGSEAMFRAQEFAEDDAEQRLWPPSPSGRGDGGEGSSHNLQNKKIILY